MTFGVTVRRLVAVIFVVTFSIELRNIFVNGFIRNVNFLGHIQLSFFPYKDFRLAINYL